MVNSNLNLKIATIKKVTLITLITLMLVVGGSFTCLPTKAASVPSGILYSVPVTIHNGESSGTGSNFQQLITVNSNNYYNYEASDLKNVEFFTSSGTIIPSWLESGSDSSTNSRFWVKLADGIPAYSSVTIYMGFGSTSTNFLDGYTVGRAPSYSDSTYGYYDNGASMFSFYDNFAGSSLSYKWSVINAPGSYSVDDGLTITGGSSGWESIESSTSFNPQTKVFDASIYFPTLSSSGPRCFAGWTPPTVSSTPQYYIGDTSSYYALYNFANDGSSTTASGTSISGGSTYSYNIWSVWATSSASYATLDYGSRTSNYQNFVSTSSAYVGLAALSSTVYVQWARVRTLPPNGVMPSVTFGTLSSADQSSPTVYMYTPTVDGLSVTCDGYTSATASGASISYISWDWGDGQSSSGDFPKSHTYYSSGYYTIVVTATDSNGKTGLDSETVYVSSSTYSTPTAMPYSADTKLACAFNGAYANYQVSYSMAGVNVNAQLNYQVTDVDDSARSFTYTTTVSGANGVDLSGLNLGSGTQTGTYSSPGAFPIMSTSMLDELKSESSSTQTTVTVPAGTFQVIQSTQSGATAWVDVNSGLIVKITGTISGITLDIQLQSTNISTTGSSFPTMLVIIIAVVVVVVVVVLAVLLLRRRKGKAATSTVTPQSYSPPPPPPPPTYQ